MCADKWSATWLNICSGTAGSAVSDTSPSHSTCRNQTVAVKVKLRDEVINRGDVAEAEPPSTT